MFSDMLKDEICRCVGRDAEWRLGFTVLGCRYRFVQLHEENKMTVSRRRFCISLFPLFSPPGCVLFVFVGGLKSRGTSPRVSVTPFPTPYCTVPHER